MTAVVDRLENRQLLSAASPGVLAAARAVNITIAPALHASIAQINTPAAIDPASISPGGTNETNQSDDSGATDTLVRPGDVRGIPLALGSSGGTSQESSDDGSGPPPIPNGPPDPSGSPSGPHKPVISNPNPPDPGPDSDTSDADNVPSAGLAYDNMPNPDSTDPAGPSSIAGVLVNKLAALNAISSVRFSTVAIVSSLHGTSSV